jgi:hypothetical protein
MTQAIGVALMSQALGVPQVAGTMAVSSSPSASASSLAGTTSATTPAAGSIDLRIPRLDPLGVASGLPISTRVASVLAPLTPVRDLTPARATNLAPPNLPLPAVEVDDTVRSAAVGALAATPNTGTILPAPVPEPNGFLVLGLAAAAYALRRRALTAASA